MPRIALLLAMLLPIACSGTDEITLRKDGEKTVRAGFQALEVLSLQIQTATQSATPDLPPLLSPVLAPRIRSSSPWHKEKVAPGESATGFHGPVPGPDGLSTWYAQDVSMTTTVKTLGGPKDVVSRFRLFIRATPSIDLESAWPEKILDLEIAIHGLSGLYAAYLTRLHVSAKSTDHYSGEWEHAIGATDDPLAYARFLAGTAFTGSYRLERGDGLDPAWTDGFSTASLHINKTYESGFSQTYRIVERWPGKGTPLDAPPTADSRKTAWFGRWARNDNVDQKIAYENGTYSLSGPATYRILAYWGRGTPVEETLQEPAYQNEKNPRGPAFSDATDAASTGLRGWFETTLDAGANFSYTKQRDATDEAGTSSGTCAGKVTVLLHDGARCGFAIDSCKAHSTQLYWTPPSQCF